MGKGSDSGRPKRRLIDGEAKARFVAALRAGGHRDAAAAAEGFTWKAFYRARYRDTLFHLAWKWALELSAADQHAAERAAAPADDETTAIAPNNRRVLQRQQRRLRFDDARKRIYLDHFAGTADTQAAAEAAGVAGSTVYAHLRGDPEFAAAAHEALQDAYAKLEAEALRGRLEAQRNLRQGRAPAGEMAQEFERVMKLLTRYDRRDGRIAAREAGRGRERRWTFDDAIAELERKLRALGIRRGALPPSEYPA